MLLCQKRHRTARITAAIIFVFGIAFAVTAPPLWGLDEVAHFNRVLEISEGHIIPNKDPKGTMVPSNLRALEYTVYMDLFDNKTKDFFSYRKDISYAGSYKILDAQKLSQTLDAPPITAVYSPFAYIGPLLGVFIAKFFGLTIGSTIFLARMGGLLSYVALIYISTALLDKYRVKILVAVIALLPVSIFQASTISADTLSIGISLVFVSLIFRLVLDVPEEVLRKKMLLGLYLAAIILPLIKVNNIVLLPLILLIPQSIFATKVRAATYKITSLVIPALGVFLWTMLVPAVSSVNSVSPRLDGLPVNAVAQLNFIISNPLYFIKALLVSILSQLDSYLNTMTTTLGWNMATLPSIFTLFSVILLFIVSVYAKNDFKDRKVVKLIAPAIGITAIVSVFAAMYVAFNPVGYHLVDGVQGRYFIPYIILILVGLMWLPFEIRIIKRQESGIFFGSATLLLAAVFIGYLLVLH